MTRTQLMLHVVFVSSILCSCAHAPPTTTEPLINSPISPITSKQNTQNTARFTINAQHVDLRVLLNHITQLAGMRLILGNDVEDYASIHVKDLEALTILREIVQNHKLIMSQYGELVWINRPIKLGELETVQIPLRYQRAEVLKQSLNLDNNGHAPFLSKSGMVVIDQRTNQLFISDTPDRITAIRRIIEWLDVPTRQVEIVVQIVEADDGFGRTLGARLGARLGATDKGGSGAVFGGNTSAVAVSSGQVNNAGDALTNSQIVNLPANPLGGNAPATFAGSLFSANAQQFLNLELSALENSGKGKVLSRPRLITADQLQALIEQGTELPYQQTSSSGNVQVSFRKANLRLEVQPQITPDNTVVLNVEISKDSVGQETRSGFAIDTKHIKTQVTVDDGGTVMLGGIETQSERTTENKVPWLGDIPYLGWLFKNNSKNQSKTELLVFITPKIIASRP